MDETNDNEYIPTDDDLQELEKEYGEQTDHETSNDDDDVLQQIDFDQEQELPGGLKKYVKKKEKRKSFGTVNTLYEKNQRTARVRKCKEEVSQWDASDIAFYGRVVLYDILTNERKFRMYVNSNSINKVNLGLTKLMKEQKNKAHKKDNKGHDK